MFSCLPLFIPVYLCLQRFARACIPFTNLYSCLHVYLRLPMLTCHFLLLLVFTYVYHCLHVFTYVWHCLLFTLMLKQKVMFGQIHLRWLHKAMSQNQKCCEKAVFLILGHIYSCIFTFVDPCLIVFNYVYLCLPLFTCVYLYLHVFT